MDEENKENIDSNINSLQLVGEVEVEESNKLLIESKSFSDQTLELEEILGYKFKNPNLLQQAFTHSTYLEDASESYERLEYIGDSVLSLLVAREDFFTHPKIAPGTLTMLRAANVDREKLARAALKRKLHIYLRHKKPLLEGQINLFTEAISSYPMHSHGLIDAPKALADLMESVIGAIFIDSDSSLEITWKVVKKLLEPIVTIETMGVHPMTRLYQFCQKNGFKVRFVDLWKDTGKVQVLVDDEFIGEGSYKPKKEIAINRAAHDAYNTLVKRSLMKQEEEKVKKEQEKEEEKEKKDQDEKDKEEEKEKKFLIREEEEKEKNHQEEKNEAKLKL